MRQIYGMKVIVLTRGGLMDMLLDVFRSKIETRFIIRSHSTILNPLAREGLNIRRCQSLKVSRDTQRLQKTQYGGFNADNRMISEAKQGEHRVSLATENRDSNVLAYGTLERILARENMLQAYA